jgi:hypothetical protein
MFTIKSGGSVSVSNVDAQPGQTRVKLTWDLPEVATLSAIQITYDTSEVSPTAYDAGTTLVTLGSSIDVYEHTSLSANEVYSYSVFSQDISGLWNSLSESITATAIPFENTIYGTTAFPYYTEQQIRGVFIDEGLI